MIKLLFFSASTRKDSVNIKLAKKAAELAEKIEEVAVRYIDLKDFDMPIYNGDLEIESGLPANAQKLKDLFIDSDGFFIASPEYNSSFSSLLKNSIDWISRPSNEEETSLIAFSNKVAAIAAASPGGLGGLRGLVPLRMMLENLSTIVIPQQLAVPGASSAFDGDGNFTDAKYNEGLNNLMKQFVKTTSLLNKGEK